MLTSIHHLYLKNACKMYARRTWKFTFTNGFHKGVYSWLRGEDWISGWVLLCLLIDSRCIYGASLVLSMPRGPLKNRQSIILLVLRLMKHFQPLWSSGNCVIIETRHAVCVCTCLWICVSVCILQGKCAYLLRSAHF